MWTARSDGCAKAWPRGDPAETGRWPTSSSSSMRCWPTGVEAAAFCRPVPKFPAEHPGGRSGAAEGRLSAADRDEIVPALTRLRDFIATNICPRPATRSGCRRLPGGAGVIRLSGPARARPTDAVARGDPPHRSVRGRADPGGDGGGQDAGRVQRHAARVLRTHPHATPNSAGIA